MSKEQRLVVLALSGLIAIALSLPATAWVGPTYLSTPGTNCAATVPLGINGGGFFDTVSYTYGDGGYMTGDSFFNGVAPGYGLYGPCGGFMQSGLGGNIGTQGSSTGTFTRTTGLSLNPINSLIFGIPVAGTTVIGC